jgi:hypothetical protein
MKQKKLNKIILLLLTFCSYCSNPVEPPSLEELLFGTYKTACVSWSFNTIGNPIYDAESTENSYLQLNADATYKMNLEIHVSYVDTVFKVYQEGSYKTIGTSYVKSDNMLTLSYWKGTLEFTPNNQAVWEVEFKLYSLGENSSRLSFDNGFSEYLFELPDSGGYIWVWCWHM